MISRKTTITKEDIDGAIVVDELYVYEPEEYKDTDSVGNYGHGGWTMSKKDMIKKVEQLQKEKELLNEKYGYFTQAYDTNIDEIEALKRQSIELHEQLKSEKTSHEWIKEATAKIQKENEELKKENEELNKIAPIAFRSWDSYYGDTDEQFEIIKKLNKE